MQTYASRLLHETLNGNSVSVITDAGYNNSGYFYRVFQKQEGISFAECRKALEQPAQDRQRD